LVGNHRTPRWTLLDIKAQSFNLFEGFLLRHLGRKWHLDYGENISSIVGRICVFKVLQDDRPSASCQEVCS